MNGRWYTVRRTYRVADIVYVQAENAAEARQKVIDHEYDDVTATETISETRMGRPKHIAFDELPGDIQHYLEYGEYPA